MITFTHEEQRKLYDLRLNKDGMEFIFDRIDMSCYKSHDTLYHLCYEGLEEEFDNFSNMLNEIEIIITTGKWS
jgi:hypothetical protein